MIPPSATCGPVKNLAAAGGMPASSHPLTGKDTTMQHHDHPASVRHELAHLLARVLHRLLTRQKLPESGHADLDVTLETLLSVTTTVNNTPGEKR